MWEIEKIPGILNWLSTFGKSKTLGVWVKNIQRTFFADSSIVSASLVKA